MEQRPFPPWLVQLAARRVAASVIVVVVCATLGAWIWVSSGARGAPGLVLLVGLVIFTGAIHQLTYHSLGLVSHAQRLAGSNEELKRANATLTESVAASRAMRQEMARQKVLAESLLAVARATSQRPVLEATLQNTLSICVALTSATQGALFLFDANGRVTRHLLANPETPPQEARARIGQAMTEGLAGWAVQNRQVARVADTTVDPRWAPLPGETSSARSAMAVPLISREAIVGVITLMHSAPRHFTEEHERLLSDAADQVAVALDNARIFDTMTRLTDRLSLVYEIGQMATQLDLDSMIAQVVRTVRASTGWPTVAAFLLNARGVLELQAAVGDSAQTLLECPWHSGERLVSRAMSIALPLRICENTSAMAAPIRIGQRVLGVLGAYSAEPDFFTNEDLELFSSVADTLAMAVAYAEQSRR